jgi:hypothetical protein
MNRYTLETQQWRTQMVESEDGEWVKSDDAQLIITQLRNNLAAMTAKRNDWEALTKIVRDVYEVSITDSPPAADNICELLATLIHFIPANEPELIRDTMAMCHDIRSGIAVPKEQAP